MTNRFLCKNHHRGQRPLSFNTKGVLISLEFWQHHHHRQQMLSRPLWIGNRSPVASCRFDSLIAHSLFCLGLVAVGIKQQLLLLLLPPLTSYFRYLNIFTANVCLTNGQILVQIDSRVVYLIDPRTSESSLFKAGLSAIPLNLNVKTTESWMLVSAYCGRMLANVWDLQLCTVKEGGNVSCPLKSSDEFGALVPTSSLFLRTYEANSVNFLCFFALSQFCLSVHSFSRIGLLWRGFIFLPMFFIVATNNWHAHIHLHTYVHTQFTPIIQLKYVRT